MNCNEIKTRLGRWYDGELEGKTAGEVGEHLALCPDCLAEIEQWRRIDQLLWVELDAGGLLNSTLSALKRERMGGSMWWLKIAAAAVIATGLGAISGSAIWDEPAQTTTASAESLSILERSFGPGALAGIDNLAGDAETTRERRR
jgi:anti-sigma factor RsiW